MEAIGAFLFVIGLGLMMSGKPTGLMLFVLGIIFLGSARKNRR